MNELRQSQSPSEEEITVCAYLIWEHAGRPEGLDKIHWCQAEMKLPVPLPDNQRRNGHGSHRFIIR
jgi:hypothetical protein